MLLKYIRPLTFFMPGPNMIFLMNIHIYNMFYICTLYFVPEINLFVFVFKSILQMYDINSKSLLFIFYIGITFAIQ